MRQIISIKHNDDIKWEVGVNCRSIVSTSANGEMAMIGMYEVELNDGTFMEYRATDCIVRFKKIADEPKGEELHF